MSIDLVAIQVRNDRRVRVIFNNTLDTGAFGSPPTSGMYSIVSTDARGVDPNVEAALIVSGTVTAVELSLDADLVASGHYDLTVVDVPAIDLSDTGTQVQPFVISQPDKVLNREINQRDWESILYGVDLIWTGLDFVEDSNGDLSTVKGSPVVHKAIIKRCLSDGLPWDPSYGAHPNEFVDGVPGIQSTLRGNILTTLAQDDRIKQVLVTLDQSEVDQSNFLITPTLTGETSPSAPISLEVPVE